MAYILQIVKGFSLNQELVIVMGSRKGRIAVKGNSDRAGFNLVRPTENI